MSKKSIIEYQVKCHMYMYVPHNRISIGYTYITTQIYRL